MTDSQKWLMLAALVVFGWLLYLLKPVITPFMVSAMLAYLCDPIVDRLSIKIPRTTAVILVFSAMFAVLLILVLILVPLLQEQVVMLIQRVPVFLSWAHDTLLPSLNSVLGVDISSIDLAAVRETLISNWRNIGNVAGTVFMQIGNSGQAIMAWIAFLVLIPVVTFYLLRDWNMLLASVRRLIPSRYADTVIGLTIECDNVLSEFLRGQLLVMLALSLIYSTGLWLAGIEFALLIGMVAGLISFVPYMGSVVGIAIAGVVGFMQYQDLTHLVYILIVFGIAQTLEGMVLSPWLVGDRIGLHPVAVMFALLAGGQLFGFVGVLLALPVAAVILVLLRFVLEQIKRTDLYV